MAQGATGPGALSPLLERDAELDALAALVGEARAGRGGLVAVEAPAGLGKTLLLAEACRRAREDAGARVLTTAGDEHERSFAWRGTLDLLAQLDGDAALPDPAGAPPDAAAFALLGALAERFGRAAAAAPPLVLALDDAHWLDEPTLRLARFLLGRLHALPLAIVLALRTDEPGAGEDGALRAILAHPATRVLAPAPLSDAAVEQLVQSVTGGRSSRRFCRRCAEVTGGNPFYVQELTAFVAGHQPDTTAPELLDDVAPPSIRRAVLSRLGRLGAGARAVARATAVLGEDARPHLVALLAQLTVDDVLLEADRLSTASLVTVGVTLRFRHPLIRAVVADDVQDGRRSAGHARAAQALHDEGAPPERVAGHLLHAPAAVVEDAVGILEGAAARAIARGAPASAARYLERALLEPLDAPARAGLRAALAEAAVATGSPRAIDHLREAALDVDAPAERARIHLTLGWALHAAGRPADSAAAFERGQADLAGAPPDAVDPELAIELETGALTAGMLDPTRAAAVHARVSSIRDEPTPTSSAEAHRLSQLMFMALLDGAVPAHELAAIAEDLLPAAIGHEDRVKSWICWNAVGTLSWCDRYDAALDACDVMLDEGRRSGSALVVAMASYARAWPAFWTGRLETAATDARRAVDIWSAGAETYLPAAAYWLVAALTESGRTAEAAAALAEVAPARWERTAFGAFIHAATATVAAAEGDAEAALDAWLRSGAHMVEHVRAPNPALLPWRTEAAILAARLERHDQAAALAGEALSLAERFGTPRPIGGALRATAAAVRGDEGIAWLRRAVDVLAPSGARLELAHARVDLGAALRRSGRPGQARAPLRDGLALARHCGAAALAARAVEELHAAGARPARREQRGSGPQSLTTAERRVADLAAQGLTNREIAARLFVTVKAVEWHLSNSYDKLAISGRRELEAALRDR